MIVKLTFILRRRWPVLAALVVVGVAAGLLIAPASSGRGPAFAASAIVSADLASANKTEVQQALVEARQGALAVTVASQLGDGTTARQVARQVSTEFDDQTYVATLRARASTPEQAEALVAAFAEEFVRTGNDSGGEAQAGVRAAAEADRAAARAELEAFLLANDAALRAPDASPLLERELAVLESDLASADATLAELGRTAPTGDVYRLVNVGEAASVAPSKLQVFDEPLFRSVLGLVLGAVAAAMVILVAERTNPRIDDPETAAALVGAPALAMVPRIGRRNRHLLERADAADFTGPFAESFRTMRSHLDFRARAEGREQPPRIMVTSATPSEGKTTTSAYLALSYVETERTPVVVGGDLRRPSIHRLFGVDRVPGLSSRAQVGGTRIPLTDIVRRDPVSRVTVVPSGPAVDSVVDVLGDLAVVTETAQASGQPVILDTAPVRVANDALDFLGAVDWVVVVVVHLGRSTTRAVSQMMHMLRMNDAQVVGIALVGSAEAADASRDYYSYYAPEVRSRRDRRRGRNEVEAAEVAPEVEAGDPAGGARRPVPVAS